MNDIYDDFLVYRDKYGLNQCKPGLTEQNGTLCSVEYILCLRNNQSRQLDFEIERLKGVFKTCLAAPGLSKRDPNSVETDSMDNTTALLVFSALFSGGDYAWNMRNHGLNVKCEGIETHNYEKHRKYYWLASLLSLGRPKNYWNNEHPNLFCTEGWYGRSPGFLALVDLTGTPERDTTLFRKLSLSIGQFLSLFAKEGESSGLKLAYLTYQYLNELSWGWRVQYWLWDKLLHLKHKDGMKYVYSRWYQTDQHPIVRYFNA